MLFAGIVILLVASVIRGWGILNNRRPTEDRPLVFLSATFSLGIAIGSLALGVMGGVMIWSAAHFWVGLVAFGLFWFLSGVMAPVLVRLGL